MTVLTAPVRSPRRARLGAMLGASAVIAAVALTGPLASPASAFPCVVGTPCEVANETEWRDALTFYSGEAGTAHTIVIAEDFTISNTDGDPAYTGAVELIVDGGGHEVSAATDEVLFLSFVPAVFTVPELTLNNITVSGFSRANNGGAILSVGSVTINDSSFLGNSATVGHGGALYLPANESIEIVNSTFEDNSASLSGGAVLTFGTVDVSDGSEFNTNTAASMGAIYSSDALSIEDSSFTGNSATSSYGGAVGAVDSYVISRSTFTDNEANIDGFGQGGAFYANAGGSIYESTFVGNSAGSAGAGGSGGAVYLTGGAHEIYDSTFDGNVVGVGTGFNGVGGAIAVSNTAFLYVGQSTFSDNDARAVGGAIYTQGDAIIDNTTLTGNTARSNGAALYAVSSPSPISVDVYQSTLVANTNFPGDSGAAQINAVSTDTVLTVAGSVLLSGDGTNNCYILVATSATGGDNYMDDSTCFTLDASDTLGDTASAMLGDIAFNGGPTHTMLPAIGSPLIDANDGSSCVSETTDQRGVMRAQGDACDIGAVEVLEEVTFTVVTSNGTINGTIRNAEDVENIVWTAAGDVTPLPPAGVSLPFGIFSFEVPVTANGWPVWVELELPSPVNQFWKLQNGAWSSHPDAVIDGTTVTYGLVDGDLGDEDLTANSVIVDPVGLGVLSAFTG